MNLQKEPVNCSYCGSLPKLDRREGMLFVQCTRCLAEGPKHSAFKPDAEAQVIAAWNGHKMFGRMGIAHLPPGMPSETGALAEWLKVLSDSILAGEYDFPSAALIILRYGPGRVMVVPKSLNKSDATRVLMAVLGDARASAKVAL